MENLKAHALAAGLDPGKWELFFQALAKKTAMSSGERFQQALRMDHADLLRIAAYHPDFVEYWGATIGGGAAPADITDKTAFRATWRAQKAVLEILRELTPYLQHAVAVNRVLAAEKLIAQLRADQVLGPGQAVLVLDRGRTVRFQSGTAAALLAGQEDVVTLQAGRLTLRDDRMDRRLADVLAHLPDDPRDIDFGMVLRDAPDRPRLICRFGLLDPASPGQAWAQLVIGSDAPHLAIILTQGADLRLALPDVIAILGLSLAEAEIALAVAAGQGVEEMALQRGVSVHTIRNQIKSAMTKARVHSQTALVRLILDIARQ